MAEICMKFIVYKNLYNNGFTECQRGLSDILGQQL